VREDEKRAIANMGLRFKCWNQLEAALKSADRMKAAIENYLEASNLAAQLEDELDDSCEMADAIGAACESCGESYAHLKATIYEFGKHRGEV
jgi:hypothetical protein